MCVDLSAIGPPRVAGSEDNGLNGSFTRVIIFQSKIFLKYFHTTPNTNWTCILKLCAPT